MDNLKLENLDEIYFINAIHLEIFSRIFPHIRHDVIGYLSASLMRVSIIERLSNREQFSKNQLQEELKKIESHLREVVVNIRALKLWDFDFADDDTLCNIVTKSISIYSGQLAFRGIEIEYNKSEFQDTFKVKNKPLLNSLLCIFTYIEDSEYDNSKLKITIEESSINFLMMRLDHEFTPIIKNNRNITIDKAMTFGFAKSQGYSLVFCENQIRLSLLNIQKLNEGCNLEVAVFSEGVIY